MSSSNAKSPDHGADGPAPIGNDDATTSGQDTGRGDITTSIGDGQSSDDGTDEPTSASAGGNRTNVESSDHVCTCNPDGSTPTGNGGSSISTTEVSDRNADDPAPASTGDTNPDIGTSKSFSAGESAVHGAAVPASADGSSRTISIELRDMPGGASIGRCSIEHRSSSGSLFPFANLVGAAGTVALGVAAVITGKIIGRRRRRFQDFADESDEEDDDEDVNRSPLSSALPFSISPTPLAAPLAALSPPILGGTCIPMSPICTSIATWAESTTAPSSDSFTPRRVPALDSQPDEHSAPRPAAVTPDANGPATKVGEMDAGDPSAAAMSESIAPSQLDLVSSHPSMSTQRPAAVSPVPEGPKRKLSEDSGGIAGESDASELVSSPKRQAHAENNDISIIYEYLSRIPQGLVNFQGNLQQVCFMNAVLSAVAAAPELAAYVLKAGKDQRSDQPITNALSSTISRYLQAPTGPADCQPLADILPLLGNGNFILGRQCDPAEFLLAILDRLYSEQEIRKRENRLLGHDVDRQILREAPRKEAQELMRSRNASIKLTER